MRIVVNAMAWHVLTIQQCISHKSESHIQHSPDERELVKREDVATNLSVNLA